MGKKKNEPSVRDLFLDTLTKIGCKYTIDEEDGEICFAFQGEDFYAWTRGNFYLDIWDYCWMSRELSDVDGIARLKKLINEANSMYGVSTVYSVNEKSGRLNVHCTDVIPFIPQITEIEDYLKMEMHQFFRVHRYIEIEDEKLMNEGKCEYLS